MKRPYRYLLTLLLIFAPALLCHLRSQSPPGEPVPYLNLTQTIQTQQWLLALSIFVILILFGLSYYTYRLNRQLKGNEINQRELNQRILAVVNNTDSIILSLNAQGKIRLINMAAISFFQQWADVELKAGDHILDRLKHGHARKMWKNWITQSVSTNTWKEVTQIKIKGKNHYFLENFSRITRSEGEYAGMIMVANDITSEHEVNVSMARQHENLQKVSKAKERMLSILAHDLKDSIYSARSMSELVIDSPGDFDRDDLLHLFHLFNKNFSKTEDLLNGLLTWMKTQTAGLQAKSTEFSIRKAIIEVIESSEEKLKSKGVELSLLIDQDILVKADREIIKTVIRNLLSNAVKYSEVDTGKVIVDAEVRHDHLILHVKDNGCGVSEEDKKKIFSNPGQFSKPGTANEKGTGFGLSLCSELLKLHNTELSFESQHGSGSDFYFSLALAEKKDKVSS